MTSNWGKVCLSAAEDQHWAGELKVRTGNAWKNSRKKYSPLFLFYLHCSNFLCRNPKSTWFASSGKVLFTSNELRMLTERPSCWPSRQPTTLAGADFWSEGAFSLVLVWWSLILISTSCIEYLVLAQCRCLSTMRRGNSFSIWRLILIKFVENLQDGAGTPSRCWSLTKALFQAPWCIMILYMRGQVLKKSWKSKPS